MYVTSKKSNKNSTESQVKLCVNGPLEKKSNINSPTEAIEGIKFRATEKTSRKHYIYMREFLPSKQKK